MLLQFSNETGGYIALLSGANGKGVWVYKIFGKLPTGFKVTREADQNKVC